MCPIALIGDAEPSSEAVIVESLVCERDLLLNLTSSGNSSESISDKGDPEAGVSGSSIFVNIDRSPSQATGKNEARQFTTCEYKTVDNEDRGAKRT